MHVTTYVYMACVYMYMHIYRYDIRNYFPDQNKTNWEGFVLPIFGETQSEWFSPSDQT